MRYQSNNKAFTLIEMITVIAIFAVISATVIANYRDFGHKTMLKNLAYSIALNIKEAQVSGLTGRSFGIDSNDYYATYGNYFNINDNKRVVFFKDRPSVGEKFKFDGELEEIPQNSLDILQGNHIYALCVYNLSNPNTCIPVHQLHISFQRPQPDAWIYSETSGPHPRASIELRSRQGESVYIIVESTGQISVQKNI